MGKVTYKDLADTYVGEALVAKTGINHGVDVIDPFQVENDLEDLRELDPEFAAHVAEFLSRAGPLQRGHYHTSGYFGKSLPWWQITPRWDPALKWAK